MTMEEVNAASGSRPAAAAAAAAETKEENQNTKELQHDEGYGAFLTGQGQDAFFGQNEQQQHQLQQLGHQYQVPEQQQGLQQQHHSPELLNPYLKRESFDFGPMLNQQHQTMPSESHDR